MWEKEQAENTLAALGRRSLDAADHWIDCAKCARNFARKKIVNQGIDVYEILVGLRDVIEHSKGSD